MNSTAFNVIRDVKYTKKRGGGKEQRGIRMYLFIYYNQCNQCINETKLCRLCLPQKITTDAVLITSVYVYPGCARTYEAVKQRAGSEFSEVSTTTMPVTSRIEYLRKFCSDEYQGDFFFFFVKPTLLRTCSAIVERYDLHTMQFIFRAHGAQKSF